MCLISHQFTHNSKTQSEVTFLESLGFEQPQITVTMSTYLKTRELCSSKPQGCGLVGQCRGQESVILTSSPGDFDAKYTRKNRCLQLGVSDSMPVFFPAHHIPSESQPCPLFQPTKMVSVTECTITPSGFQELHSADFSVPLGLEPATKGGSLLQLGKFYIHGQSTFQIKELAIHQSY
jgi:hypothetical protein